MFTSLRNKWKVSGIQLVLILFTFAIGGSLTGYAGKKIMNRLPIEQDWLWTIIYIVLITMIWPMAVILVSIPFGQFRFFRKYIKKLGARFTGKSVPAESRKKHIAIFASGAGSNAEKIIQHFKNHNSIHVVLVVCNNPAAGVLNIAIREGVPTLIIERERFFRGDAYLPEMEDASIDLIVLAGFLWKLPGSLVQAYKGRILNIHPALLPEFGGKGMYGANVHSAVLEAGKKESGISIHVVDELYDHGKVLFQAKCEVRENDTVASLSERIHKLEHEHYTKQIEKYLKEL